MRDEPTEAGDEAARRRELEVAAHHRVDGLLRVRLLGTLDVGDLLRRVERALAVDPHVEEVLHEAGHGTGEGAGSSRPALACSSAPLGAVVSVLSSPPMPRNPTECSFVACPSSCHPGPYPAGIALTHGRHLPRHLARRSRPDVLLRAVRPPRAPREHRVARRAGRRRSRRRARRHRRARVRRGRPALRHRAHPGGAQARLAPGPQRPRAARLRRRRSSSPRSCRPAASAATRPSSSTATRTTGGRPTPCG